MTGVDFPRIAAASDLKRAIKEPMLMFISSQNYKKLMFLLENIRISPPPSYPLPFNWDTA